jgi:hypothetical protein
MAVSRSKASIPLGFKALVSGLLLALSCCALAMATETVTSRRGHPWGRFRPGSWKKVRLVTETFDAQGKITTTSIARTRTTLADVGDEGIKLRVEATVDVAGKQVESEPQFVAQDWRGEPFNRETVLTDLGDDQVTISGMPISCRVEKSETSTSGGRVVTKTWYSDRVSPYVLRRESTTYSLDDDSVVNQTRVEVIALSRAIRVLRRHRQAAELRIVSTHACGTTRTTLWSSLEVPGGVVAQESEEFDASGRLARRSKLDLIGYAGEFTPGPVR